MAIEFQQILEEEFQKIEKQLTTIERQNKKTMKNQKLLEKSLSFLLPLLNRHEWTQERKKEKTEQEECITNNLETFNLI